jgi:hypothetical protein
MERCEECGFDSADLRPPQMVVAIRSFGRRYRVPLTRGLPGEDLDEIVRRAPGPGVWSALEYAAHVGHLFRAFDDRVRCALAGNEPDHAEVDWEGWVASAAPKLDREQAADGVDEAAHALAFTLDELNEFEWELTGLTGRGRPVPLTELAAIAVHEGSHHLLDIGRVLRAARGR